MSEEMDSEWEWDGVRWCEVGRTAVGPGVAFAQISDLHLGQPGRGHEVRLAPLCQELADMDLSAVLVTGDIAHAPEDQAAFELAATSLRDIGLPIMAIPGNHDIRAPYPATSIFDDFFGPTPRVERIAGIEFVLLDSFRWLGDHDRTPADVTRGRDGHYAHGAVTQQQLLHVEPQMEHDKQGPRVVAVHHHLHQHRAEPGKDTPNIDEIEMMRPLYDADDLLSWCTQWQVDLVLTGHQHAWTPPEQFAGIPNVRGTKTLAEHGVARIISLQQGGTIHVADHRIAPETKRRP
jgi:3',5'-cyclic AMP phosphodiesterase CpdA